GRAQILAHVADDLEIDPEQIVTRHARLARHSGGHDDDVRSAAILPARRSRHVRVVADDRAGLFDVERLALGETLLVGDIEKDDLPELSTGRHRGQLAADVARPDEGDLMPTRHLYSL